MPEDEYWWAQENGECDEPFNCEEHDFDWGQCDSGCGEWDIADCSGECWPEDEYWWAQENGHCDEHFNCEQYDFDWAKGA